MEVKIAQIDRQTSGPKSLHYPYYTKLSWILEPFKGRFELFHVPMHKFPLGGQRPMD